MKSFQSVDSRHTHIQINCRCLHVDVHIWILLIHFELETDLFVGGRGNTLLSLLRRNQPLYDLTNETIFQKSA